MKYENSQVIIYHTSPSKQSWVINKQHNPILTPVKIYIYLFNYRLVHL